MPLLNRVFLSVCLVMLRDRCACVCVCATVMDGLPYECACACTCVSMCLGVSGVCGWVSSFRLRLSCLVMLSVCVCYDYLLDAICSDVFSVALCLTLRDAASCYAMSGLLTDCPCLVPPALIGPVGRGPPSGLDWRVPGDHA